jgi:hypothetical protein
MLAALPVLTETLRTEKLLIWSLITIGRKGPLGILIGKFSGLMSLSSSLLLVLGFLLHPSIFSDT